MTYTVLLAVLFGILEGVTEWLPISSTAHLLLLRHFLPIDPYREAFFSLFEVVIQLFALLAVLFRFWPLLWPFSSKQKAAQQAVFCLWGKILLAALPAAVLGLFLNALIEERLSTPLVIATTLIGYGLLFLLPFARKSEGSARCRDLQTLSPGNALTIGLFQVLALLPGTSRSGATVLGALLIGVSRPVAALFSFFLGIPTMLGATALRTLIFLQSGTVLTAAEWLTLLIGCAVSFFVSLLTVDFLMGFVRRHSFAAFGIYRILLGIAVLVTLIFL